MDDKTIIFEGWERVLRETVPPDLYRSYRANVEIPRNGNQQHRTQAELMTASGWGRPADRQSGIRQRDQRAAPVRGQSRCLGAAADVLSRDRAVTSDAPACYLSGDVPLAALVWLCQKWE